MADSDIIEKLEAKLPPRMISTTFKNNTDFLFWLDGGSGGKDNATTIRQWCIAKGIPESDTYRASGTTLAKAYNIGAPYLSRWLEGIRTKKGSRKGFRDAIEVNFENDGDAFAKEFSGPKPKPAPFGWDDPIPGDSIPAKSEPAPSGPIDATRIAEAADRVIGPRIDEAVRIIGNNARTQTQLAINNLKDIIDDAIHSPELTEALKDEIRTISSEATYRAIRDALPTKLQVTFNGNTRELPAEPRHEKFNVCLKWLMTGRHLYMVGPMGSGKTHMFSQLCAALGRSQDEMVPIGQSLTKYDLSGYKSPTGEYIGTLMRDAIETGKLVVIDEGDMWAAAALGFLNTALAGNGWCAFPDAVVKVHPKFQVILAANTYGHGADMQYQGRNPLDKASLDRFVFIDIDYDPIMEKQIFGDSAWLRYVHKVREGAKRIGRMDLIPSMRAIAKGLDGYAVGLEPDEICDSALWMGLASDVISKIKQISGEPPSRTPKEVESEEPAVDTIDALDDMEVGT